MKRFSAFVVLLASLFIAQAQTPDDQYVHIFNLIQEADGLYQAGQPGNAMAKYIAAETALQRFQKGNPNWNSVIVRFRLNYVSSRIEELRGRLPGKEGAPKPQVEAPKPPDATQLQAQVAALSDQVRQLQADNVNLEAKLKEALALQPAAVDPRELARAEERIQSLQKQNDLLQVRLDQEKAKVIPAVDVQSLDQARKDLAEANQKLSRETERANSLELERKALQTRLEGLVPQGWNVANIEKTRQQLEAAQAQLTEQKQMTQRLSAEREALQSRVKTLTAEAEASAALRAENELLKKQLAEAKHGSAAKTPDTAGDLAQAQAQVAALQSEKELLRLEKVALENRVKQLQAGTTPATSPAPTAPAGSERIQQLEKERDDLQKRLEAANQKLAAGTAPAASNRAQELEKELAALRLRLEVLEARKVPYTAEELALFKQAPAKLAAAGTGARSITELPAGSSALVAEAQRFFASKQYDKAKTKYLEVLQRDENNALTLANLAEIELQMDHPAEADQHIQKAITAAPDDPYNQYVLGRIRFQQKRYDEALDALSQATQVMPNNAQAQNALGMVLSEKGMRGPAETALRRAIQIDPGFGEAHNNLAIIYLSQTPPLLQLARWHYQKAVSAGTRNAKLEEMLTAAEKKAQAK